MEKLRIQKVLSKAGIASRRAVEQMILEGRISVNGEVATSLPCFVDPQADRIEVDGKVVQPGRTRWTYFLLNKPRGVVCTQADPKGRPRAIDLVPDLADVRAYCVGRLDVDSTGLIILTNDGELTQYLTHPRFGVPKTYLVEIDGELTAPQIAAFSRGVCLDGRRTSAAAIKVLRPHPSHGLIEVVLTEGRNCEIRRVLLQFGLHLNRLKRVAIGPVTDRGLKLGACRPLTPAELARLRTCGQVPYGTPVGPATPAETAEA